MRATIFAGLCLTLAGCGSDGSESESTVTVKKKAEPAYVSCFKKQGAKVSEVTSLPKTAVAAAEEPFTARFPGEGAGLKGAIVVLPIDRPALLKKTFNELKPKLEGRGAIKRSDVLVILGKKSSHDAVDQVLVCVGADS